jgi:AraC-like DNA-binding protein
MKVAPAVLVAKPAADGQTPPAGPVAVQDVLADRAVKLLDATPTPASKIAERIRRAAPDSFTRALRRWQGMAPLQWRVARRHRRSAVVKRTGEKRS